MAKSLTDMTNEELWRLFPIILSQPDPAWKDRYLTEKAALEREIGAANIFRLSHIGSTAVPNLLAKPTIDMLLEIKEGTDLEQLRATLQGIGYIFSPQPNNPPPQMMFLKGYTPEGFQGQAYHLHIRYSGDWDELYFRDYLISHSDAAKKYAALRLGLKEKYEFDRDGYTAAKTGFIKNLTKLARDEMPDKYRPLAN